MLSIQEAVEGYSYSPFHCQGPVVRSGSTRFDRLGFKFEICHIKYEGQKWFTGILVEI